MKLKRISFIISFLFLAVMLSAQQNPYIHYTIDDGLPSSTVYDLLQDENGYMWFATDKGVCRFDGYDFKTYTVVDGLASNDIWELFKDNKGRIWCSSFSRDIAYFDVNREIRIVKFPDTAEKIRRNGIQEVNRKFIVNRKPYIYEVQNNNILSLKIPYYYNSFFISIDENSNLWFVYKMPENNIERNDKIGTPKLLKYNPKTRDTISKKLPLVHIAENMDVTFNNNVSVQSNYLYYWSEKYIYSYNINTHEQTNKNIETILKNSTNKSIKYLGSNIEQRLWQVGDSIFEFDADFNIKNRFYIGIAYQPNHALLDREENLWLSTFDGVFCLPKQRRGSLKLTGEYSKMNITAIAKLDNRLVIGDSNGNLYLYENHKLRKIYTPVYRGEVSKIVVYKEHIAIVYNSNEETYLLKKDDLLNINLNNINKYFKPSKYIENEFIPIDIKKIYPGGKNMFLKNNELYLSTGETYIKLTFNEKQRIYSNYFKTSGSTYSTIPFQNKVWVGGIDGLKIDTSKIRKLESLIYFNKYDKSIQNKSGWFTKTVLDLSESKGERLWVATDGFGIYTCKDCINGDVTPIKETKDDIVRRLFIDDNTIWAATNHGVKKITIISENPFKYKVKTFTIDDGLVSNHINEVFVENNQLYAATERGLSIINLAILPEKNDSLPKIIISNLEFFKKTHTSRYWENKKFSKGKVVQLKRNQNNIRITYTGISFKSSEKIRYVTTLIYDRTKPLTDTTFSRTKEFVGLRSGNYKFTVFAIDVNGQKSDTETVVFYIKPYFYERREFAVIFSIIFLIGVGVIGYYIRQRKLNKKIARLELNTIKSQMNPHFISNAMGAIQYFIVKRQEFVASEYLAEFAHLMKEFLRANQEEVITLKDELDFIQRYIKLEQLRYPNTFEYKINLPEDISTKTPIPPGLLHTYIENAINHGLKPKKKGGILTIDFEKIKVFRRDKLIITITDNGIGRERAEKMKQRNDFVYKSRGMDILKEKVNLLNQTNWKITFEITDAFPNEKDCGTMIKMEIIVKRFRVNRKVVET